LITSLGAIVGRLVNGPPGAFEGVTRSGIDCRIWRVAKEWSDLNKLHSKLQHAVTVL